MNSLLAMAIAGTIVASPVASLAVTFGDALQRPAMQVAHLERSVLLAAAKAGSRIVAVGERGIAMYSDDEGASWRQAQVPTSVSLTAVQFVDPQQGWAVGHGGTVLASSDGGSSWLMQLDGIRMAVLLEKSAQISENMALLAKAKRLINDGPDKPLLDLHFVDRLHGIVVGAFGLALSTQDGGKVWMSIADRLDNPNGFHFYSLKVRGEKIVIAGEQGLVFLSKDNGISFRKLKIPYSGTFFRAEWLGDQSILLAGLRGQIWRSDDLGETWKQENVTVLASFSASASGAMGSLWLANQTGELFAYSGRKLIPMRQVQLPPTAGLLVLDADRLLALTVRGAVIIPLTRGYK